MRGLLACPFCRELFSRDEGPRCPECDVELVDMTSLPPSLEGQLEAAEVGPIDPPEDQRQPFLWAGRGRGLLTALGAVGLTLFFQPWVTLVRPDEIVLSGYDLARTNATWLWGGAVGWFLLIPLVASRRTVNQLRGIRVIACTFALMTAGEAVLLLARPPAEQGYFSSGLEYSWGLYAGLCVSLIATIVGSRLGGNLADLRDVQTIPLISDRRPGESLH